MRESPSIVETSAGWLHLIWLAVAAAGAYLVYTGRPPAIEAPSPVVDIPSAPAAPAPDRLLERMRPRAAARRALKSTPTEAVGPRVQARLELISPADGQEFYQSPSSTLSFTWNGRELSEDDAQSYLIEVAGDPRFQSLAGILRTRQSRSATGKMELKPGAYYWRVQLLDGHDRVLETSDAFRLILKARPPLFAPPSSVRIKQDGG